MSDSVGGAGGPGDVGGSCGVGGASDVGGSESCAANAGASASVDGAMNDVSGPEVSAAADSVTGAVDGYQGPAKSQAPAEEAGICVGTESECAKAAKERAQREADAMTDEQAIRALDGAFLHDPTSLTPAQVKGLEALSRQPDLHERTRGRIRGFLEDHYHNTDRLGFYGQLGRPDAPR